MEQEPLEDGSGEYQQQASCVSFEGCGDLRTFGQKILLCYLIEFLMFFCFFMQVKSVLDPCEANNDNSEDDNMSVGHESDQDDDFSDTEVKPSQIIQLTFPSNVKCLFEKEIT